ncbi:carboxypeptidase-like regulatory domain-containing protein [Anaerolineales bacterium HSG24]|nr:carboxypeptidase-like regulatory domain-containing protein [Anaerolineales bacterium HSG24]
MTKLSNIQSFNVDYSFFRWLTVSGLLFFLLTSMLVGTAMAQEQVQPDEDEMEGILTGQLINRTTDQPLPNMEVKLHLLQDNARLDAHTTQTDADGNYSFSDLPTSPSIKYTVEAIHNKIFYLSKDTASFTPEENLLMLDIEVYDTTATDPGINITQIHYLISLLPTDIRVDQIMVIGNSGLKTYIGQDGKTFLFALPDEAKDVMFQNDATDERFVLTDGVYADTMPIPPGMESASIMATYFISHDSNSRSFSVPVPADAAHVSALMQDQGVTLTSDQLEFVNQREIQGELYSLFVAADIKKGSDIVLTLSDLDNLTLPEPEPASSEQSTSAMVAPTLPNGPIEQTTWLAIIMGLGGLAVVLTVIIYPTMRPQPENMETKRQRLLLMLTRLDDMTESGELDETVYRRARAKYKAELMQVIQ